MIAHHDLDSEITEEDFQNICTSLECTRDLLRKIEKILEAKKPDAITEARKLVARALQIVP
jgi:hypothetical protein